MQKSATTCGYPDLHDLCKGYRKCFNHLDLPMRAMAHLNRNRHLASEVMERAINKKRPAYKPMK